MCIYIYDIYIYIYIYICGLAKTLVARRCSVPKASSCKSPYKRQSPNNKRGFQSMGLKLMSLTKQMADSSGMMIPNDASGAPLYANYTRTIRELYANYTQNPVHIWEFWRGHSWLRRASSCESPLYNLTFVFLFTQDSFSKQSLHNLLTVRFWQVHKSDPINCVAGRIEEMKLSKYTFVSGMFLSGVTRANQYIYNCFGATKLADAAQLADRGPEGAKHYNSRLILRVPRSRRRKTL